MVFPKAGTEVIFSVEAFGNAGGNIIVNGYAT
jgi:hypothetical protein